jgi:chromosome partitioning protein
VPKEISETETVLVGVAEGGESDVSVLVVVNNKGGVGKTVLAAILAEEAARSGKRVLCVDMDPQGNMSAALGAMDKVPVTVADVLQFPAGTVERAVVSSWWDGDGRLALIVSTGKLYEREFRLKALSEAVALVRKEHDLILVDTPPSLSRWAQAALLAADRVLVPVSPSSFALSGIEAVASFVAATKPELENRFDVVVTLYDRRITTHRELTETVQERYGVLGVLSRANRVVENVEQRRPWWTGVHRDRREEYRAVAARILGK